MSFSCAIVIPTILSIKYGYSTTVVITEEETLKELKNIKFSCNSCDDFIINFVEFKEKYLSIYCLNLFSNKYITIFSPPPNLV